MSALQRSVSTLAFLGALAGGCHTPVLWVGSANVDGGSPQAASPTPEPRATPELALGGGEAVGAGGHSSVPGPGGIALPASAPQGASTPAPSVAGIDAGMEDPRATSASLLPRLPQPRGACPSLTGSGRYTFRAGSRSLSVQLTMPPRGAPAGGPLVLYFHSLGTDASEVTKALGPSAIDAIVAQGGVVASFQNTPCLSCGLPEDVVWYDEDDPVTDQVVACTVAQAQIDTRRIHVVGFSSGALHALHLLLARSNFIASVVAYSGGNVSMPPEAQDPTNKVPALLAFGRAGADSFAGVDFHVSSQDWADTYGARGYYSLLCDHDGGHEIPTTLVPHALRFLVDHPLRVAPEPYAREWDPLESTCRHASLSIL